MPRPRPRATLEHALLGVGLASAAALTWAALAPRDDAAMRGQIELERRGEQAAEVARLAWERWLREDDPRIDGVDARIEWTPADLAPPARNAARERYEAARDPDAFDVLLADARRAHRAPAEGLSRLEDALARHPDAPGRAEGLLAAVQLAVDCGDRAATAAALARVWEACAFEDARAGIAYRLAAAVAAAPLCDDARRAALQADLADAWASGALAVPDPGDRFDWRDGGRFLPDPTWDAWLDELEALSTAHLGAVERARDLGPRRARAFTAALGDAWSRAEPGRWAVLPTPSGTWLARTESRGGGRAWRVPPAALRATLRREARLADGFVLDDPSTPPRAAEWRGRPFTPEPGAPRLVVAHPDPDAWTRSETGRLRTLRAGFGLLALATLAASGLSARALRRGRLLAEEKSRFVAGVSHDLRTPLASILLLAENLQSGRVRDDEQRARYHAALRREALRLRRLVDDVLDFARIERGQGVRTLREPVDVAHLADELEGELAEAAALAGGTLTVAREALPASFDLDADAVRRAVHNLVQNALRHSGARDVELRLRGADGRLELEVADAGRGIPRAHREQAFVPFVRLATSGGAGGGTGLGLAIVREVARAHGGDATIVDDGAPGTRVRMTLVEEAG